MLVMIPDSSHNGKINIEIVVSVIIPCYSQLLQANMPSTMPSPLLASYNMQIIFILQLQGSDEVIGISRLSHQYMLLGSTNQNP